MKLESLSIKNYRVFQDVQLKNLPGLCVFVGANGSGKSTLFDLFGFLKDALNGNVRTALQKRGGFKEVVTRGCIDQPIEFVLQFRLEIGGVERLVSYLLEIRLQNNRPIVTREILRYKRGKHGSPYHFLDFSHGAGYAILNEEDFNQQDSELEREEQTLDSPDILAVKGLGQFQRFKAANAVRQLIENWHVSDFHISEARPSTDAGYAEHLSSRGDNTALVAQYLFEQHPDIFNQVLEKMKQRVPGVEDVKAVETDDGRIVLKFQDGSFKDPFIARYVSDGTIKMFAYLLLLNDPTPHPLLCVEEPENQLYPSLMPELAEEFRSYSDRGGQVMVSSHSPDMLNSINLDEIFWLKKVDGVTCVERAADNLLLASLVAGGELAGALWKQGLFDGVHP
ncbi:AAA family ATPase [Pelagibaculum spongiae]|uniref:Chromosome segregation protein SMC n=1 Tax=Pelagibaculum spongiae TaxID=2080658 RepID=A0A2V1GU07_9GAMM|nr:AAA family ATPase [Pelagibaculum spongiae]PVZ65658.1 chromosome segregation protein SMC [Pelagibaculum spongiae]